MLDYHFDLPVRLYAGEGCVRRDGAAMKALGSRCLLVTGPTSAKKSGALEDVTAVLEEQGIAWALFDQVRQNPLLSACKEAGSQARAFGAQFIVGIGGGSPLDAAKAVAVFAANDIRSITVARMEVPCCGGLESAVRRALAMSGKQIPLAVRVIATNGELLEGGC